MRTLGSKDKTKRKSKIQNIRNDKDNIVKLYNEGYSGSEIARMYYCSLQGIKSILIEEGVWVVGRHPKKKHSEVYWNDRIDKF